MFCATCACELPAVAKFCVKCGSPVAAPQTARQRSSISCINCAKLLDAADRFCSGCGHKVIESDAATHEASQFRDSTSALGAIVQPEPVPALSRGQVSQDFSPIPSLPPTHPQTSPVDATNVTERTELGQVVVQTNEATRPYAKFVGKILLGFLFASVSIFAVFDASARNVSAFGVISFSTLLAILLCWSASKTYGGITNSERSLAEVKRLGRKALVSSAVFGALYLGLAALLGSVIGQNRAEATQLNADIEYQKELAGRIGKARNSVSNSIGSYLVMYAGIESDVRDYSSTLSRLRQEVPTYNSKFPDQRGTMQKYATTIEKETRRSELLKRQIVSAKKIASLDEYQQAVAWRNEMLPILEEEDALDRSK